MSKLNKATIEFTVKALEQRIRVVSEHVQVNEGIIRDEKRRLKTKEDKTYSAGGLGVTMKHDDSTSNYLIKEAQKRLDKFLPNLNGYKKAREDIRKKYGV